MKKIFTVLATLAIALTNVQAQKIPISFGGGGSTYNSAITSWNPFDKNANVVLTNNFLTATSLSVSGAEMVRCNKRVMTATKHYWEVTAGGSGFDLLVGIDDGTGSLTNFPGMGANSIAYYASTGTIYKNGISTATIPTYGLGDVIGVALDLVGNTVQFYKNGSAVGSAYSIAGGSYYPAIGRGSGVNPVSSTANFGATSFVYSIPGGFTGGI